MLVLVAYGSKRGGTKGLAEMLGADLEAEGMEVEVRDAGDVTSVADYDAVVVGGSLYMFRWNKHTRRLVRRCRRELRERPTFFFSSGPLDDSATEKDIPPVTSVAKLMAKVGATEHVTFGGRMLPDVKGFPAGAVAKNNAGDWRDPEHVRSWAHRVAGLLTGSSSRP